MLYRTLVVAPRTNLAYAEEEVTAVVNALNANLLQGSVTANMVLDKVSEGWDVIWFMTHGNEKGILLSDGSLDASTLTTFIRTAEARLVVLNTCQSIGVALAIHNELLTNLICTLREVPDREAFFTGKQLAFQLARGKSFSQAYLAAKPGQNTDYIFLVGKDRDKPSAALTTVPLETKAPSGPRGRQLPNESEGDYAERIQRLDAIVSGDMLWGQEGLVNTVKTLLDAVNNVKRAVLVLQLAVIATLVLVFIIMLIVFAAFIGGRL